MVCLNSQAAWNAGCGTAGQPAVQLAAEYAQWGRGFASNPMKQPGVCASRDLNVLHKGRDFPAVSAWPAAWNAILNQPWAELGAAAADARHALLKYTQGKGVKKKTRICKCISLTH